VVRPARPAWDHDVASRQRCIRYRRRDKDETVHPHSEERLHLSIRQVVLVLLIVESDVGGTLSLPQGGSVPDVVKFIERFGRPGRPSPGRKRVICSGSSITAKLGYRIVSGRRRSLYPRAAMATASRCRGFRAPAAADNSTVFARATVRGREIVVETEQDLPLPRGQRIVGGNGGAGGKRSPCPAGRPQAGPARLEQAPELPTLADR